jgi:hypothetical protein
LAPLFCITFLFDIILQPLKKLAIILVYLWCNIWITFILLSLGYTLEISGRSSINAWSDPDWQTKIHDPFMTQSTSNEITRSFSIHMILNVTEHRLQLNQNVLLKFKLKKMLEGKKWVTNATITKIESLKISSQVYNIYVYYIVGFKCKRLNPDTSYINYIQV